MITLIKGTLEHLDDLSSLFDAYRIFYEQSSDLKGARDFLKNRIENEESILFMAYLDNKAIGFTQLFPSFSSVSMKPLLILNDLYVDKNFRQKGIGEALLIHAQEYCRQLNYKGLALETATDNPARQLYEKLGWEKDTHCFHYFWTATVQ
ncbi:MAG: GNAT family N-acetyltransferase [Flavobacteriaceae bacterium]|nr:GNAT family N-acetyltransferase [Flavobacteriaceae bacterium]MDH3795311.1 GNAT family N-acetyltransferase [Flavobacteriaceae bacterium]